MKATNTHNETTTIHYFQVEHKGKNYEVRMHTNLNGKFLNDYITLNGFELDYEGGEGQVREDIITYLDENWDDLVRLSTRIGTIL